MARCRARCSNNGECCFPHVVIFFVIASLTRAVGLLLLPLCFRVSCFTYGVTAVSILQTPPERQITYSETERLRDMMVDDPSEKEAALGPLDAGACVVDACGRKTKKSSAITVDGVTGGEKRKTLLRCVPEIYRGAHTYVCSRALNHAKC